MKKIIYLFAITIALSLFSSLSVKAATSAIPSNSNQGFLDELLGWLGLDGNSNSNTKTTNYPGSNTPSASTQLPINDGTSYLLIIGITMGIVVVKKYKAAAVENQV